MLLYSHPRMNYNSQLLRTLYTSTFGKYIKFKHRYDKAVESGKFKKLSRAKQSQLIGRLRKLYDRLKSLQMQLKLLGAGAAFSLTLSFSNPATAQTPAFVRNDVGNPLPPPRDLGKTRIALVDIDNDGDLDSFAGDKNGDIQFFRNDSPRGKVYRFTAVTDTGNPFNGVNKTSNAAPAFADVDGDGDFDAVVGNNFGEVFFFKNTGSKTNPAFTEQTGSNNPFNGIKGTTSQDGTSLAIPEFVDIDRDNDIDLFIGSSQRTDANGTYPAIQYFENTGTRTSPAFSSRPHPLSTPGFGESVSLAFADVDKDGDLDAVVGQSSTLGLFRNDGSTFTPVGGNWDPVSMQGNPFPRYDNFPDASPALGDIDGDGDLDFLLAQTASGYSRQFILYYENTGSFVLEDKTGLNTSPFGGVYVGTEASPTFVDLDNDGDLDAVIGEKYSSPNALQVFENVNGRFFSRPDHPIVFLTSFSIASPVFADIDDDGDQDLFVGWRGIKFFSNSNGDFYTEPTLFPDVNTGNAENISLAFLDIDGDNDLDAFVANSRPNNIGISFYRNTGSATLPEFTAETAPAPFDQADLFNQFPGISSVDIDRDGDLDLAVTDTYFLGWYDEANAGRVRFFANNGNQTFTELDEPFIAEMMPRSITTFADLDGDGDMDAFVGNGYSFNYNQNGTITYLENTDLTPTEEEPGKYIVYNAVSANADALNSFMRIEGIPAKNKVTIFNRWGDKVYEVSDYDNDTRKFEGKSDNGKDLPAGTYYYSIEVTGKKQRGYLSLKR